MPGVSVALPVYRDAARLPQAISCIAAQTLRELEILVVLNGSDEPTRAAARRAADADPRVRILDLPEPGLAAALNAALEAARHDLVARMDSDDLCPPERLALQARAMESDVSLAALGTAWELLGEMDQPIATVRPPTDPRRLRWRLLLGNLLAHGSMMLRRPAILKAGGYDARLERSQDYELWLRLSTTAPIGCLSQVLYQHRSRSPEDPARSTREQADLAAPVMLDAWSALPALSDRSPLLAALSEAICRDRPGAGAEAIEALLDQGATREGLMAWLWTQHTSPPASRRAAEAARRSRLREIGIQLRALGVHRVHLWGVGDHTRFVLDHQQDLGLEIAGLVDDSRACIGSERFGHEVRGPGSLSPADAALISSDWHEEAIWASSAPHRARGVRIFRMYDEA
jgi:hypothetical protein